MSEYFFGEWGFLEGNFFTMPSWTVSAECVRQGYTNAECCWWGVSAKERSGDDYLEELAERISREVRIKRLISMTVDSTATRMIQAYGA